MVYALLEKLCPGVAEVSTLHIITNQSKSAASGGGEYKKIFKQLLRDVSIGVFCIVIVNGLMGKGFFLEAGRRRTI